MAVLQISSPLHWPAQFVATDRILRQVNPQFQLNMPEREAIAFLEDEVSRTSQVTSANLSCDAANVNSTLPTQYLSKNTGASLKLTIEEAHYYLCCDKWQSLAHNIYALHLGLRYMRQLSEWGLGSLPLILNGMRHGAQVVSAVQLSGSSGGGDWQAILGLGPTSTLEDANALYRVRAKSIGENNPEQLRALNMAIQQARESLT